MWGEVGDDADGDRDGRMDKANAKMASNQAEIFGSPVTK
jgi:hypothetical protein